MKCLPNDERLYPVEHEEIVYMWQPLIFTQELHHLIHCRLRIPSIFVKVALIGSVRRSTVNRTVGRIG